MEVGGGGGGERRLQRHTMTLLAYISIDQTGRETGKEAHIPSSLTFLAYLDQTDKRDRWRDRQMDR